MFVVSSQFGLTGDDCWFSLTMVVMKRVFANCITEFLIGSPDHFFAALATDCFHEKWF
jgi:hypothetical protein